MYVCVWHCDNLDTSRCLTFQANWVSKRNYDPALVNIEKFPQTTHFCMGSKYFIEENILRWRGLIPSPIRLLKEKNPKIVSWIIPLSIQIKNLHLCLKRFWCLYYRHYLFINLVPLNNFFNKISYYAYNLILQCIIP